MTDDLAKEILAAVNQMRSDLTRHMSDEEGEIASIRDDLNTWRFAAEKRHAELIRSLESWTAKMDCTDAFLTTPDGKVDLRGHKDDHLTRLQFDEWTKQVKKEVTLNAAKVGTVGILTWVLYVLWEAFLKGPR